MTNEFFSSFPTVEFDGTQVKNLTIRLDFISRIKNNISLFQYVLIKDGDRPEDIARQQYNDPTLYWVILFVNDIVDPYYDWLLTEKRLFEYVSRKYGSDNVYSIHHYETTAQSDLPQGTWVDFGTPFSVSVTNYDYEDAINEEKRKIKILKPSYIAQVISEYQSELNQNS